MSDSGEHHPSRVDRAVLCLRRSVSLAVDRGQVSEAAGPQICFVFHATSDVPARQSGDQEASSAPGTWYPTHGP